MDGPRAGQIRLTVGVGASAGGLAALKDFVRNLPTGAGLAVVIVQHLDPDHKSLLVELLDKHSTLPVYDAQDGLRLQTDTVYVIPPDSYLSLESKVLRLTRPRADRGRRKAIDHFLVSLAKDCGNQCAGMVLSGTGNDGTAGLAAIRAAGGLTVAQDPGTAEHGGMPLNAIDAAVVDSVVPIEQMAALLESFANSRDAQGRSEPDIAPDVSAENLADVAQILRQLEDFDLEKYKPRTLQRRITRRMRLCGAGSYTEYLALLRQDRGERSALTEALLINVTDFFRDPESYQVLENEILPAILRKRPDKREIRVWVPGCATGEEAYSIAMVFLETLEKSGVTAGIRIFATDVDEHAIEIARRGGYAADSAQQVPATFLDKYFCRVQHGGGYRIAPAVRELVSFAVQDVVSDPPFNRLDLVSCRNLLIYLRKDVQEKVLRSFYFALDGDAYLMLGSSESAAALTDLFAPASRRCRAYRKIPGKDKRGEVLGSVSKSRPRSLVRAAPVPRRSRRRADKQGPAIERALLDKFLPPGVVVDAGGRILYNYGDWKAYMAIPAGEPRQEIARLVLPQLRPRIRAALYKAQESNAPVSFSCFLSTGDEPGKQQQVRVEVAPLCGVEDADAARYGIFFHALSQARDPSAVGSAQDEARHTNQVLEQELSETREELQNTIEELETSTEELKASNEEALSANEELQSANEELEASAEELRSLNEELVAVNVRLKEKVEELQAAHNDVANFFSSTNIPTIFINPALQIERFTPAAEQLLNLDSSDVGRVIGNFEGRLLAGGLAEGCRRVLLDLHPLKDEIRTENGRWFVRQVTPYRTQDRRIDGVVVVYQDVTDLKHLGSRARSRELQQSVVANLGLLSLGGVSADELIEQAVRRVADVLQVDLCKVLRYRPESNDLLVIAGVGLAPGIVGQATVAADKRSQAGFTLMSQGPVIVDKLADESRFTGANLLIEHHATSGMSCLIKHSDPPYGVLAVHTREYRKFTQDDANFIVSVANLLSSTLRSQETTRMLRQSEVQFRTVANSIPQLAWMTDSTGYITWYNDQWFEYTGTTFEQMRGWGWQAVHHPDHVDRVVAKFRDFIENGTHWEDTFPLRSHSGEYRWFLSRALPIRDEHGKVARWFGTNTDITEQRRQEKDLRASEEKLRLAITTNAIGTFEYYPVDDTVKWDEMLNRVWGIADNEQETMQAFWEGLHPDDVLNVEVALAEATASEGDGYYHVTYRVINRQTGELSWIEASGQTLFEDGRPTRMVGMVIDITARKELEESLTKVVNELKDADSRKNEFLAVLGHELRNPLAALNNSVEMLGLIPTATNDVLGIMRNSVRTMGRLLDDLLDLNRISQDKIQLDLQVVDVADVIRKATDIAAGECAKRHQKLDTWLEDELYVMGDATRLEQIFSNLLTNACKYTPEGGRITVSTERIGEEVVVQVQDTGIGIETGNLERIFDPFFQVVSSAAATSGLGIGLALSRKLAELHGGSIAAVSDGQDRGTTFVVRFPGVADARAADDPERSGAWPVLPPGLSVVLIDDNEDILKTLPGLLESLNCDVRTARTAEFGLELARSIQPDAVLVDIGLPDMSGHEVARKLRAEGFGGLLVAVSGYGHKEARERSSEVGFDHHLAKPAKLKQIAGALAKVRKTGT